MTAEQADRIPGMTAPDLPAEKRDALAELLTTSTVRELVSLADAARRLSVPYSTVKSWVAGGRLKPAGLDFDDRPVYDLAVLRRLAETTKRRKRRRK